jgi:hypothetical protein
MDAQLLIGDIRTIRVTRVHAPSRGGPGNQKFVRIITVRYSDESEYQICLTSNEAGCLEIAEDDTPPA